MNIIQNSWQTFVILLWLGCLWTDALTVESFPPLVPEGEQLANSPEEFEKLFKNISRRRTRILSIAYSPDGKHLASGSLDGTVQVWELATGKEFLRFEGHTDAVNSIAYSPDGKHLASGSDDDSVRVWKLATGEEVLRFNDQVMLEK